MKYLISISLLLIYLGGAFHTSWTIVDFYWNRDYYTQNYCINLDAGITQCRASCYLQNLLEEKQQTDTEYHLKMVKKIETSELTNNSGGFLHYDEPSEKSNSIIYYHTYHFDYTDGVFHPPKAEVHLI